MQYVPCSVELAFSAISNNTIHTILIHTSLVPLNVAEMIMIYSRIDIIFHLLNLANYSYLLQPQAPSYLYSVSVCSCTPHAYTQCHVGVD